MISVYSIVAKTDRFIKLQADSLRNLRDPYVYTVVNNDRGAEGSRIHRTCQQLEIRCINAGHVMNKTNPSFFHAHGLNAAWKDSRGTVLMLDMDIILTKPFSVYETLGRFPVAGVEQIRGDLYYPWPGLLMADKSMLPGCDGIDFDPLTDAYDTGGSLGIYLANKNLAFYRLNEDRVMHTSVDGMFCCRIADAWLHYQNATDWARLGKKFHDIKWQWFKELIK
jgi:hypothetical protein